MDKGFKVGDKIKLNRKESDLMCLCEGAIKHTIGKFVKDYREELSKLHGGVENALITVVGKLYADLIAMVVAGSNNDIEIAKRQICRLLAAQMDEDYAHHMKDMQIHDGTH